MRRLAQHSDDEEESKINLTPMLDVVFIMLIFFIVTATFVKEVGLDLNPPDPNKNPPPPDPDKRSIVVKISKRDRITIAKRRVDGSAVRANIERLHAENPEAPVVIVPAQESSSGTMIEVFDAARQAGVINVQLGHLVQ